MITRKVLNHKQAATDWFFRFFMRHYMQIDTSSFILAVVDPGFNERGVGRGGDTEGSQIPVV